VARLYSDVLRIIRPHTPTKCGLQVAEDPYVKVVVRELIPWSVSARGTAEREADDEARCATQLRPVRVNPITLKRRRLGC
jgi:hypothetical protein